MIEDMLRTRATDVAPTHYGFRYNNNNQTTIYIDLFKAIYGQRHLRRSSQTLVIRVTDGQTFEQSSVHD